MPLTADASVNEPKTSPEKRRPFLWGNALKLPSLARDLSGIKLTPAGFALVAALAAFFVFLSHRPLWQTDLWGHLAYGRLIVAQRALPATEPLMPLCRDVPFVDFSWLSEIIGYAAYAWQGAAALQFLYAASITLCVGLVTWCVLRKTASFWAAALAAGISVWVGWQQFLIVRPQLAGCVCFVGLFTLLLRQKAGIARALAVAGLFAAWANLHGSFLIGLALLATFTCGRSADVLRRTGRPLALLSDLRVRRGVLLFVVAIVAVMLNPYGWRIYAAAWNLSSNANLADLVEWKPLGLWMWQARAFLAVSICLFGVYLATPRRISATELLLLLGLGAATLAASRMIVWWGPLAAYYASLHAAAIWKRGRRTRQQSPVTRPIPAIVTIAVIAAAFASTPLAAVLRGSQSHLNQSLSPRTPIAATDFLRENPPCGQTLNTLEWGDYLLWAGPPGIEVFVASHVHLVPQPVWQDYLRVITLEIGWQQILERYRVDTVILDTDQHAALADALREDHGWSVLYEDDQALVIGRKRPRSGEITR
jgi:hypothetical protein